MAIKRIENNIAVSIEMHQIQTMYVSSLMIFIFGAIMFGQKTCQSVDLNLAMPLQKNKNGQNTKTKQFTKRTLENYIFIKY